MPSLPRSSGASFTRRQLLCAAAGTALGTTRRGRADAPLGDLLTRITRARAGMKSLRGPFTQTRTIGLLATEVRSHGTLTLLRPDRLRWELAPPDDVVFWVGPEGLAYRSAHGHGQMSETNAKVAAALDDLRTLLGGDIAKLGDRWNLQSVHDGPDGAEIEATPISTPPGGLTRMRFALGPDLMRPTHVLLVQGSHDRTTLDFGDLTVNGPVDPATMTPPAG